MVNNLRLETPNWGSIDEEVYEPSEDSFLLVDALEADLSCDGVIQGLAPGLIVEVGSGSGVVISALAKALGPTAHCIALDINPKACTATSLTSKANSARVDVIQSDLCSALAHNQSIDLLIFNPPYVVTPPEEIAGTLARAWAGGIKGRQVTDRLLQDLPSLMSKRCLGYIVAIEENLPQEICDVVTSLGFRAQIVLRRKVPGEKLCVIRFSAGLSNNA